MGIRGEDQKLHRQVNEQTFTVQNQREGGSAGKGREKRDEHRNRG